MFNVFNAMFFRLNVYSTSY